MRSLGALSAEDAFPAGPWVEDDLACGRAGRKRGSPPALFNDPRLLGISRRILARHAYLASDD